jgi:Zn-dependent protease
MYGHDLGFVQGGLLFFLILVSSLCVHEWAHAWVADRLGDPTPRSEGRVTLNPLPHIDPLGTILFPLICIFAFRSGFFFGWARPVAVDARNFRNPVFGDMATTAAGPLANILIAMLAAVCGGLYYRLAPDFAWLPRERIVILTAMVINVNAWLFVFNMLPFPPLDGGRIMRPLINMSWETFVHFSQYSMWILLAALYFVPAFAALVRHLIALAAAPSVAVFSWIAFS